MNKAKHVRYVLLSRNYMLLIHSTAASNCKLRSYSSQRENLSSTTPSDTTSTALEHNTIPSDIAETVHTYGRRMPTSVSLQTLMQTGKGSLDFDGRQIAAEGARPPWGRLGLRIQQERIHLQMASYLRDELPVRLAHRIQDLDQMPLMRNMEAVQTVKDIYVSSFREMVESKVRLTTSDDEDNFANLLGSLYQNHQGVLVQMAKGAYQLREDLRNERSTKHSEEEGSADSDFARMEQCHDFLNRFYMSRIGIRFLAGQYLSLRSGVNSINDPNRLGGDYIGMICQTTSPSHCVRKATTDASSMCRRAYGRCPRVEIEGRLDLTFPYIPTYLHYILLELLKNALRATMERHLQSSVVPPVRVIIADGQENEDVVIKVADEGGGIPRSQVDKIWSYLFTTAPANIQKGFIGHQENKDFSKEAPIAGLGYGLPISRSYCRYFGGDLDVISMEGYGCDAFVHLKRLGDSKEPVPL